MSAWLSSLSTEASHDITAQMAQVDQFITELSTQNDEMMDRLYVLESKAATDTAGLASPSASPGLVVDTNLGPSPGPSPGSTPGPLWHKNSVYGQNVVTLTRVNEELTVHAAKLSERLAQGEHKVMNTVDRCPTFVCVCIFTSCLASNPTSIDIIITTPHVVTTVTVVYFHHCYFVINHSHYHHH